MASVTTSTGAASTGAVATDHDSSVISATDVLKALGSLKITVGLFAASLIIVLVGTLAQDELNMQAVKSRYFLSWIAWLRFDDFVPQAFYHHANPFPGMIPFPGGAMIGALLMVNLLAAKATRFQIHAKGSRLFAGLSFIVVGIVVAGLIIASGNSSEGLQGAPPISYEALWQWFQVITVGASFGLVSWSMSFKQRGLRFAGYTVAAIVIAVIVYTVISGERIGDPGMRIVWQLAKGILAGLILLVGCNLIFGRQGGNMLLHFGVGLLMIGQFTFGDRQLEQRISLVEGESTNTLINMDQVELSFIVSSDNEDDVIAVPAEQLIDAVDSGETIKDDSLPVDIKVLKYFKNSDLNKVSATDNPATTGFGMVYKAVEARQRGGADSEINLASAYVDLIDKKTNQSAGVFLVSQLFSDAHFLNPVKFPEDSFDTVTINDKEYKIGLKFSREVKPYWVHLEDVQRRNYSGTETPRDYSSFIRIIDPETGEDRRDRVWMNNPLRYRGETFFQSEYVPLPGGKERTGLQVVRNGGWLIPYLACSIIALGMLAHFTGTLKRFVGRRERERAKELAGLGDDERRRATSPKAAVVAFSIGTLLALIMLIPIGSRDRNQSFDFVTVGKIPTQYGGRMMPLEAYARIALKAISNRESLPIEEKAPKEIKDRVEGDKMSAVQWLLEAAASKQSFRDLQMIRIDSEEVRSQLTLPRRESKLYSISEISENWNSAMNLIAQARQKDVAAQSFKEKKLIELTRRMSELTAVVDTFEWPQPRQTDLLDVPDGLSAAELQQFQFRKIVERVERVRSANVARIIPPTEAEISVSVNDPDWKPFSSSFFDEAIKRISDEEATLASDPFVHVVEAYVAETPDPAAFNQAVDDQIALSSQYPIAGLNSRKIAIEHWMEAKSPRTVATVFYILAIVMGLAYFALGGSVLRNATWGILLATLLVHSVAILARVYITGRAPVINLHSSAVFIGWAAVLGGLVIDRIYRLGFGNIMAATAGTLSSLVAYSLDKGDTMPVLQAVLDTQFWLTTHVISVALGYVATMVSGILGIIYLFVLWFRSEQSARSAYRMAYGATCFGILFSTIGTILGGLWADDSWGRFWGWDPKENGALLIVIWNALMLHARWDGMVKALGFSILAIGGNIITAWSWFGTNELGIGLHSYGFTEGVLLWLTLFMATQIALIIAGIATAIGRDGLRFISRT